MAKKDEAPKKDPVGKAVDPEKVETLDIPANEPYPTGKGRDPEADFEAAHGFKRAQE